MHDPDEQNRHVTVDAKTSAKSKSPKINQQSPPSRKKYLPASSLPISEAVTMSASLTDQQLAIKVRDGLAVPPAV